LQAVVKCLVAGVVKWREIQEKETHSNFFTEFTGFTEATNVNLADGISRQAYAVRLLSSLQLAVLSGFQSQCKRMRDLVI